jgi:carboxylesterase type B
VPFYGIPYGATLTAQDRWRPPREAPCWKGVFEADTPRPDCLQRDHEGKPMDNGASLDKSRLSVVGALP